MPIIPRKPSKIPVPVAEGGTNSTTAGDARTALGVAIGTNVQAQNAVLQTLTTHLVPGQTINLGITLAANTFTICSEDGTALSATNIGYVGMPSNTAGKSLTMSVVADATITDGNGNQLGSNSFGITTTANWANDMPLFIYAINFNDTTVYFGLSRNPTMSVTPATVYYKNVGGANTQTGVICMTNSGGDDLASKPCVCIGAVRIQWTT